MARNAVIGGVILAAIEGLSVVLSRYLIPAFERRQLKEQMPVDTLEPPVDPLHKLLTWDQSTTMSMKN
jgi:hypothetical protein